MSDPARTGLLLAELQRDLGWQRGAPVPVTLRLSAAAAGRADLHVGFAVAAQLLGRLVGTVSELGLVADSTIAGPLDHLLPGHGALAARCVAAITRVGLIPATVGALGRGLEIGVGAQRGTALSFDCVGWTALVNPVAPGGDDPGAPLGAIVGACLAANELFALVHSPKYDGPRHFTLSAWDSGHEQSGPDIAVHGLDLGPVDVAGAGAVAQTALWTLAAAGVRATVWCADPDRISRSNLERLPFCALADVGQLKVNSVLAGLRGSSLQFVGAGMPYEDARRPAIVPLLSAVDDDRVREALANTGSPLLLSATTGGLAMTIEWHDLDPLFACLACGHPVQAGPSVEELARRLGIPEDELRGSFTAERTQLIEQRFALSAGSLEALIGRDVCGNLDAVAREALGIDGPTGSVGFLSWVAGALLAVELIAHRTGHGRTRPRMRLLTLLRPTRIVQRSRKPRPDCSCQSDFFTTFYARRRAAFLAAALSGAAPVR